MEYKIKPRTMLRADSGRLLVVIELRPASVLVCYASQSDEDGVFEMTRKALERFDFVSMLHESSFARFVAHARFVGSEG